jgi:hypothetical protein
MAEVKTRSRRPKFLDRAIHHLAEGLASLGIDAQIDTEPIGGTKLHRVIVVSSDFEQMRHSERQSVCWRIIKRELSEDEELRISMILTVTPDDLTEAA